MVQGLSRVPSGNPLVVQLDLNLDGILKVSARERATGLQKQVVIENALARFEREERDQARERLEQLWALPGGENGYEEDEDELGNGVDEVGEDELPSLAPGPREGQREAVQARALLEKAERLLERTQPEDRAEVERLMTKVRTALTDRQWDKVTAACNELADTLFYLEDVLSVMRCPVCKADNVQGPQCRRCKADLGLLFELEAQRRRVLTQARRCLRRGDGLAAARYLETADWLRGDEESRRLSALAFLLERDFAGAWASYQRWRTVQRGDANGPS